MNYEDAMSLIHQHIISLDIWMIKNNLQSHNNVFDPPFNYLLDPLGVISFEIPPFFTNFYIIFLNSFFDIYPSLF